MNSRKHILVTGANRSGSTWVGRVIASHGKVDNIIEPLNPNRVERFGKFELPFWYPNINEASPESLKTNVHGIVESYLKTPVSWPFLNIFSSYEGHGLVASFRKRLRRTSKPIKMLKDPTALFCIPWLVEQFPIKPVILIRHPAAYALSIKEKNWWFDFRNFLGQPGFFRGPMESLKPEVEQFVTTESSRSIIENAALLWKVFYTRVLEYQKDHPNWYYVTHEDLSMDPYGEFQKLFEFLELEFNDSVQDFIRQSTEATNDKEFVRDARSNATKWQHLLGEEEKNTIRELTWDVAQNLYTVWE